MRIRTPPHMAEAQAASRAVGHVGQAVDNNGSACLGPQAASKNATAN